MTAFVSDFDHILTEILADSVLAVGVLLDQRLVHANPGCRALLGLDGEAEPPALWSLAVKSEQARVRERLEEFCRQDAATLTLSFPATRQDGATVHLELHAVPARLQGRADTLVILFDSTDRHRHEEQLSFLAFLDPLTGLPNRAMFLDRFRETLIAARESGTAFAVLQADLDGFKAVNDTHGHAAGDLLLNVVAERLASCVRGQDVVARQGGDEFAILLPAITSAEDARGVAERMIREVSAPIPLGDSAVTVGISIGIALYPEHAADIDTLLSLADRAMYASKDAGRNRSTMAAKSASGTPISLEFLNWNENNAVGIALIDSQHRALVELINRLGSELKNGRSRDQLLNTFRELVRYTEFHFEAEEGLMRAAEIQSLDAHHLKHQQLLADIRTFGQDLDRRSMALTMRYLQEWLVRHIDTMDKGLGRLLLARGQR